MYFKLWRLCWKKQKQPNKAKLIFIVFQSSDFHLCLPISSRVRLKAEVLRKEAAVKDKEEQKLVLFKVQTRVYSRSSRSWVILASNSVSKKAVVKRIL